MVDRKDIGSWLSGPPRPESAAAYPGEPLGLPESGPGAMAPTARRVGALFLDGVIAQIIAMGLLGYQQGAGGVGTFTPLLVFVVMNILMVGTGGFTIGHRLFGLRVELCPRGYAGMGRGLVRSLLLGLGIPALVVGQDGRGLHDKAAGTVILRAR